MYKFIFYFFIFYKFLFGTYEHLSLNNDINSKLNLSRIETKENNFDKNLELNYIIKEEKIHKKFGEDFFNALHNIEKNINRLVNDFMIPDFLKEELKFKMVFKDNADLNLEYIYSPKSYKNTKIKVQWEEDKLFLRCFYKYEFKGIN